MSDSRSKYTVLRSDFEDTELLQWWSASYHDNNLLRNTFFQSPDWNQLWCEYFVRPDSRRELVLLRIEREGCIVGAAPFFLQKRNAGPFKVWRYFLWLADRLAQYPDLITSEADAAGIWDAVIRYMHREFPDAWVTLHDVLPESSGAAQLNRHGELQTGDSYFRLPLGTFDDGDCFEHCVPHMKREIARTRKLLENKSHLDWNAYTAPDADLIGMLISLNRRRFGGESWFADENSSEFFHSLCDRIGHELLITVVTDHGNPVHLLAAYLHGGTVHYVLSGMDDSAKRWSPGTMNIDNSIRWAARNGYAYFDFLRGDEAYKREFNPEKRTSSHLTVPAARGKVRLAFANALQTRRKALEQK